MLQAGRNFNSGDYVYAFNGKRMDSEVSGTGNSYDYGFRIYNPRIGRFLSVDPLTEAYPWYTPYQYAGNKPIAAIDIDGLEEYLVVNWLNNLGEIIRSKLKIIKDDNGNVVNRNSTIGGINRSKSTVHTRTIDANGNISDNFSNNLSQVNQIMNVDRNPKIVSQDHSVAGDGIQVKGGTQEYYQTITTYSGGGVVYGSEEVKNLGSRFYPSGKVVNGSFSTSIGDAWISLIKEKIDEFKTQNSKIKITGIQFTLDESSSFGADKKEVARTLLKTNFPDAKIIDGSVGKLDYNLSVTFKKGISTSKTSTTTEDPAGN